MQRLDVVHGAIADLFGAVTIVTPATSYTLATEHSPLPLALHNGLAVPIRVRLHLDVPPGMQVTDYRLYGAAKLVPANTDLVFQLHYSTTGTPMVDRPEVGFTLAIFHRLH